MHASKCKPENDLALHFPECFWRFQLRNKCDFLFFYSVYLASARLIVQPAIACENCHPFIKIGWSCAYHPYDDIHHTTSMQGLEDQCRFSVCHVFCHVHLIGNCVSNIFFFVCGDLYCVPLHHPSDCILRPKSFIVTGFRVMPTRSPSGPWLYLIEVVSINMSDHKPYQIPVWCLMTCPSFINCTRMFPVNFSLDER
jgi:hypothetical protein